jgi:hypothetical protein
VNFLSRVFVRQYAAGARQGSSIANVKMVQYGRFQIPVRLLDRWLEKRERTRVIDDGEAKTENKMVSDRIALTKGVRYGQLKGRSATEVATMIEQRVAALGPVKRSWVVELVTVANSPSDWKLVQEAWIRFAETLRIAKGHYYSRIVLLAAIRCDSVPALVTMLSTTGLVRLQFSITSAKLLVYAAPAEVVGTAVGALLHRQPDLAASRKFLSLALLRAEEPGAATLGPAIARLLAQLPSGDPKPAVTASALLRSRLSADPSDAINIAADALKINTVDSRSIAVFAALLHGVGSPDHGVAVANAHWGNEKLEPAYLSALFARRAVYYPQAQAGVHQFLLGQLNNDAAAVDRLLAEGKEWHNKRIANALYTASKQVEEDGGEVADDADDAADGDEKSASNEAKQQQQQ